MCVDKRLKGVNAVRILSRLNRVCREKQDAAAFGRLSGILKPIVERHLDLDTEEAKFNARMSVHKFVKAYAYIT